MKHRVLLVITLITLVSCRPPQTDYQPQGTVPADSKQITVDQFGWRTGDVKIAVLAKPVTGHNSNIIFTLPAAGAAFEVRRASDNTTAYTGTVTRWNGGATDAQSGDQACRADFSGLTTPGTYYIYDPVNDLRSYDFEIRDDIYNDILKTAVRAFYYQRCGTAITAACGGNWIHSACHAGANQDQAAHLYNGADQGAGTARDVSGGWHDAGDYNKYVPFTLETVWHLMTAYELNPTACGDDWNIPESNNGVPDILDEIKYELDWLLRMQNSDGSVCNRVGVLSYTGNYPQDDDLQRFYTQPTTWATSTMAGLCAHGARLFASFSPAYATALTVAAENAWTWLTNNSTMTPVSGEDDGGSGGNGFAAAAANSTTDDDARRRLFAAAELYKTTGTAAYRTYFDGNYASSDLTDNGHHPISDNRFDTSLSWITQSAMIVYASTTVYATDGTITAAIRTSLQNGIEWNVTGNYSSDTDPYRAYMWDGHYCWGSNQLKMHWAFLPLAGIYLGVNTPNNDLYRNTAEAYLHYIHGRNPLSVVYLTNMGTKGADLGGDNSVMEAYHGWFHDGSPLYDGASSTYGQAPGFLAGGPNRYFSVSDIIPPAGQPPQKSFLDWNTAWNSTDSRNENSWEITEPGIYYQAKYCTVIACFCAP